MKTPPAKFVFHGPNKGLMKYLHETYQILVVDDLGGGEFSNPQFIDRDDFERTRARFQEARFNVFGEGDGADLVEVVIS